MVYLKYLVHLLLQKLQLKVQLQMIAQHYQQDYLYQAI